MPGNPSPLRSFLVVVTPVVVVTLVVVVTILAAGTAAAQSTAVVDPRALETARREAQARWDAWQGPALQVVRDDPAGPTGPGKAAEAGIQLVGVTPSGQPVYFGVVNAVAAATVGASRTWPGGSLGLALDGANRAGELALWDAGSVRRTHQEFTGRVTLRDPGSAYNFHSTHVAGTMIAAGIQPAARGMSFAGSADSYDWQHDDTEMTAAAAAGLLLSNHSYTYLTGWNYDEGANVWYWYGDVDVSTVEDYGFGLYAAPTRAWDQLAAAAPYYLICQAAGNDRNHWGPGAGAGHYYYQRGTGWTWSTAFRQADGADGGYDTIPYRGNAKNVLTVGAVADIPAGYQAPADVVMTEFSGWGPTDDGRIKPDLVANGVELYSTLETADNAYGSLTGTSMAAPCATGSLNLLAQQYRQTHGALMRAATLKALVLHTADEAGAAPGPDYRHGWGLLDVAESALLIADDAARPGRLLERSLASGTADTIRCTLAAAGPARATICWADPPGPTSADALDPPDRRLVNDLDLRVVRTANGQTSRPWVLNSASPSAAATTGDNTRDNVERVDVTAAAAGEYMVIVGHKGTLAGAQAYSLVLSGLRPQVQATDVADLPVAAPLSLAAYPNPFNPRTTVAFTIATPQTVSLGVYALDGRRLATLVADASLPAGEHQVAWDGRDDGGRPLASGVYVARLSAGTHQATHKLVLMK